MNHSALLLDRRELTRSKQAAANGHPALAAALADLRRAADEALKAGPFSVTHKSGLPPSGDRRDFMSVGPYWWPDPVQPDGLPYIRRDGEINPERTNDTFDNVRADEMVETVKTLALAYHLTGNETFAERAAGLLRVWFLDNETRMNPHLEYGQAIPGRVEGRGIGIIDTVGFIGLADAVLLLRDSPHWSDSDHQKLQAWFADYLDWLKTSDKGAAEQRHHNNHGTWFDAQIVAFALFAGQPDLARQQVENFTLARLEAHIEPDGRQPHELERTLSFDYSIYNLTAFLQIARMAESIGLDLWKHENQRGGTLRKAVDFLLPYLREPASWSHQQIRAPRLDEPAAVLLALAFHGYRLPEYLEAMPAHGPTHLMFPATLLDH